MEVYRGLETLCTFIFLKERIKMTKKKITKKKITKKANVRLGRPRVWGDEKKFNKTIRLSESQEILIYSKYRTLQSFFEESYATLKSKVERKKEVA